MAEAVTIEYLHMNDLQKSLNSLHVDARKINRDLKKIIRSVLGKARAELRKDTKGAVPVDPRQAYKAVRYAVWKKALGGNVNILSPRKNNGKMYVGTKQKTLMPGQRGGNRMMRSSRTENVDGYWGSDRGFILRFLNAGTPGQRLAGSKSCTMSPANRGHISARGWFERDSTKELNEAAERLDELINRAIQEVWQQS